MRTVLGVLDWAWLVVVSMVEAWATRRCSAVFRRQRQRNERAKRDEIRARLDRQLLGCE